MLLIAYHFFLIKAVIGACTDSLAMMTKHVNVNDGFYLMKQRFDLYHPVDYDETRPTLPAYFTGPDIMKCKLAFNGGKIYAQYKLYYIERTQFQLDNKSTLHQYDSVASYDFWDRNN